MGERQTEREKGRGVGGREERRRQRVVTPLVYTLTHLCANLALPRPESQTCLVCPLHTTHTPHIIGEMVVMDTSTAAYLTQKPWEVSLTDEAQSHTLCVCVCEKTSPPPVSLSLSLPPSLPHSLTHSLPNSLTHSLTHSLSLPPSSSPSLTSFCWATSLNPASVAISLTLSFVNPPTGNTLLDRAL